MIRVVTEAKRIGQESERFTTPGCTAVENIPFTRAKKLCLRTVIRREHNLAFTDKLRYCVWQRSQIPKIDCGRLISGKCLLHFSHCFFKFSCISSFVFGLFRCLCGFLFGRVNTFLRRASCTLPCRKLICGFRRIRVFFRSSALLWSLFRHVYGFSELPDALRPRTAIFMP